MSEDLSKRVILVGEFRILHTGDNFKEMLDFSGKHLNFYRWFGSEEDFIEHCKSDGGKFKIFYNDGSHQVALAGDELLRKNYRCGFGSFHTLEVIKGQDPKTD